MVYKALHLSLRSYEHKFKPRRKNFLNSGAPLKTSASRQTISRTGINKNKESLTSAQVFGLLSSTVPFGFPSKIVTILDLIKVDRKFCLATHSTYCY